MTTSQTLRALHTFAWWGMLSISLFAGNVSGKHLVMLAGPHHSGGATLEEFFYLFADKHVDLHKPTYGLRRWRWPHYDLNMTTTTTPILAELVEQEDRPPHAIFEYLVTKHGNLELQKELMDGIQKHWEDTENGIILGTPEFDRSSDGLVAMQRVANQLQPESVTVILNYRTPRIDQWVSMWKEHHGATNATYQEYMCKESEFDKKEAVLATAMNPMHIAKTILEDASGTSMSSWNIVFMDLVGIQQDQRDVATVISCDVLSGTTCDFGTLRNHAHHNYTEDFMTHISSTAFDNEQDADVAEKLLLARDCHYESFLRNHPQVKIYHNHTMWKTCHDLISTNDDDGDESQQETVFSRLSSDTSLVFRALLSQVDCGKTVKLPPHMISAEQILSGNIPSSDKEWKKFERAKRAAHKKHGGRSGGKGREFFMFLVILMAAFAYQAHRMQEAAQRYTASTKVESEIVEFSDIPVGKDAGAVVGSGGYKDDDDDDDLEEEEHADFA